MNIDELLKEKNLKEKSVVSESIDKTGKTLLPMGASDKYREDYEFLKKTNPRLYDRMLGMD